MCCARGHSNSVRFRFIGTTFGPICPKSLRRDDDGDGGDDEPIKILIKLFRGDFRVTFGFLYARERDREKVGKDGERNRHAESNGNWIDRERDRGQGE